MLPVGCPAKVSRIDVCCKSFLKTVKLVWPDEVHLTAKAGTVAQVSEVVTKSGDGRRKLGRVVIDS
jgi:hypothetical protein